MVDEGQGGGKRGVVMWACDRVVDKGQGRGVREG